jgi:DNA-binding LytR/AlgR family response regulator
VIDDEPLARRILKRYISALPTLKLEKECSNAMEAASYLLRYPVDVIFLDIKMPEISGLDFLKTLSHPPQVIITTAYSEFALEGYELSVVDYLLKPISFERFLKAINKLGKTSPTEQESKTDSASPVQDFIFLKSDQTYHQVRFKNISHIQGYGNYARVVTGEGTILISETMTRLEGILPSELFIRIHRSYIINISRIKKITENKITIGEKNLPIGRTYKAKLMEILKKHKLRV